MSVRDQRSFAGGQRHRDVGVQTFRHRTPEIHEQVKRREENGAADGVEIDIIESIRGDENTCNSALHWDGYRDAHKSIAYPIPEHNIYDGKFHTFGLWRTPEAYIFYIDNTETWRVTPDQCEICPEQGYMKLSVEGSEWAGTGTKEAIAQLPADMLVDYVRVYREKP